MSFTVQHKRSSEANRRPEPSELEDGQLGININNTSPGMFFKTNTGALIKAGPAHVGTDQPQQIGYGERSVGEFWVDTSSSPNSVLKVWTGTGWESIYSAEAVATVFVPPTSQAGLPVGAVWNNGGTLQIVT